MLALTPLLVAIITGFLGTLGLIYLQSVSRANHKTHGRPYCRRCGYDLSGSLQQIAPGHFEVRGVCSECAATLEDPADIRFRLREPLHAAPLHLLCICLIGVCVSMSCLLLLNFPSAAVCRSLPLSVLTSSSVQRLWPTESLAELRTRLSDSRQIARSDLRTLLSAIADGRSSMPMPHQLEILQAARAITISDEDLARYARGAISPESTAPDPAHLAETPNASQFTTFDLGSTISLRWRPERIESSGPDVLFAEIPSPNQQSTSAPQRVVSLLHPRTKITPNPATLRWISNLQVAGERGVRQFVMEHSTSLRITPPAESATPSLTPDPDAATSPPATIVAIITAARIDAAGRTRQGISHWVPATQPHASLSASDPDNRVSMAARVTLILDHQTSVPLGTLVVTCQAPIEGAQSSPPVIYQSLASLPPEAEAGLAMATKAELLIQSDVELENLYLPSSKVWRGTHSTIVDVVPIGAAHTQHFEGWRWTR